jgi:transposase
MTSLILPSADTAMMNLFLAQVAQNFADYFIVMQVDQASWHRAKELQVPENIRLIFQPPYSPEANPVEHLWEELREKFLHNHVFPSLDELIEALCQALTELTEDKARLRSMMFSLILELGLRMQFGITVSSRACWDGHCRARHSGDGGRHDL